MQSLRSAFLFVVLLGCSKDSRTNVQAPRDPLPEPTTSAEVEAPAGEHMEAGEAMHAVDPGGRKPQPIIDAIAVLHPTRGNLVAGTVRFHQTANGLEVTAAVDGLPPGPHAYHVHLYGDCSSDAAESAGPHFHFHGSSFDTTVGVVTGNLGELDATASEVTTKARTTINASLHGRFSILGRTVVVHEVGNDPAITPDGGAGARMACGVIGIANTAPPESAPASAAR